MGIVPRLAANTLHTVQLASLGVVNGCSTILFDLEEHSVNQATGNVYRAKQKQNEKSKKK